MGPRKDGESLSGDDSADPSIRSIEIENQNQMDPVDSATMSRFIIRDR